MDDSASLADLRVKMQCLDSEIEMISGYIDRRRESYERRLKELMKELTARGNCCGEDLMVEAQYILESGTRLMELAGKLAGMEEHKSSLESIRSAEYDGCPY